MKNKGFTLIELIAVVVIMAIIALIATPNIVAMLDNGRKKDYVADARGFISKASYMYKQDKYKNNTNYFVSSVDGYKITLGNIKGIDDYSDPYDGKYDENTSYVLFTTNTKTDSSGNSYVMAVEKIYLKSCDDKNCHEIAITEKDNLSVDSVEEISK